MEKEELNTAIETIFQMDDINEILLQIDRKDFWKKDIKNTINNNLYHINDHIGKTIEKIVNILKKPLKDISSYESRKYHGIFKDVYGHDITIYKHFTNSCSICCEIKPLLGDDYPCVLRKMRQQIDSTERNINDRFERETLNPFMSKMIGVLIVKEFKSEVTSLEQVQTIFKQHSIKLILLDNLTQNISNNNKEFIIKKIQELEKELQIYKEKLNLINTE